MSHLLVSPVSGVDTTVEPVSLVVLYYSVCVMMLQTISCGNIINPISGGNNVNPTKYSVQFLVATQSPILVVNVSPITVHLFRYLEVTLCS